MRLGWILAAALSCAISASALADTIVSVKFQDYQKGMVTLGQLGVDIAGIDFKKKIVDIATHNKDILKALDVLNVKYEVLATQMKVQSAPDDKYKNPEEVEEILKKLEADHSDILKLNSIGKTIQGRDIWAVKISDNVAEHEANEPAILFNGMHHAREVMSVEVPLDIATQLVTNYASDEKTKNWVDNNEIWVVPQMNPDGNHIVWTDDNMWRKNARGDYGVDINRNYPYRWGECNGSSGFQWSDTYRGASAGSEPETQTLMKLVGEIKPVFSISYHSYSELVLYPYSCDGEHVENAEIIAGIGNNLAKVIKSDNGATDFVAGTSWEILYAVDGGDIDWMFHEHGVLPFVIELNSRSAGFQPPYSLVAGTLEKQKAGWSDLLNRLSQSSIRGYLTADQLAAGATVEIEGLGGVKYRNTAKPKADGSFHVVVNPGMYKVTVAANGIDSVTKETTVGATRVDLQF